MNIVGRKEEQLFINECVNSKYSEFLAVFGRRRVGKTFLIKEFFNNQFTFHLTGLANSTTSVQLNNFNIALRKHSSIPYPEAHTWFDAFEQLIHLLEHSKTKGKKVIFLDELPWMDTPRSGFVTALEHFWNHWASARKDIFLIVCGSATSWMINKLIKSHGGLHNRITKQLFIKPFTLKECEDFFKARHISMNRYQILESYMIFGGIPFYLSLMNKKMSLAQNVDALCFAKTGALRDEFANLYASLFKHSENHIKIVKALSSKTKGLSRDEIVKLTKLSNGGSLSKTLEELEQCGFILKYNTLDKKQRDQLYQLVDFYTLFYMNFIHNNKYNDEHFWTNSIDNAKHRTWSGYAFEQIGLSHIKQIKNKLGIAGVLSQTASWRSKQADSGAQIDLLIDRNDQVINLCEMKYANSEFVIDSRTEKNLRNKKETFLRETKTKKAIHLTMITTYGIKRNQYFGMIQSDVNMDDLFV